MPPAEKHILEIDSAELAFGERRILSGVYLLVETGGVTAVLGRNGCGKSCLMKILSGSLKAGFCSMRIDGKWHRRFTEKEIRYLPQHPFIPGWLRLERALGDFGLQREDLERWFPEFISLRGTRIGELSGGEQRILECFIILRSPARFILLDEPFSALDSYLKWNLEIELADLLATFNGPILWVSHDRDECYRNCRSVCVMEDGRTGEVTPMDEMIRHPGSVSAARLAGCKNFFAAEARDGKVYLPEWNVALPLAGMENTFTTIGIPDNAVTMSENGAMSCTVCRVILGVEENILLLRPEGSAEGAPMLRITVGHESDLQAGAAVRIALDYSKLLLL